MFVLLIISILAIFLTILDSRKILKDGLLYSFILVTFVACIRYNYGNDYMTYMYDFERVGKYSFSYILSEQESLKYSDALFKDVGAVILFRILNPFGFCFFAAVVSAFQGIVFYRFIRENVSRSYYWIAMSIYLFNFNFYVLPMSMIRQGLVITLFVWAWHFMKKGKFIIPLIIILIGITIHKSAVILLPTLFIRFLPLEKGKIMATIIITSFVILMISSGILMDIYSNISELDTFAIYAGYEEEGGAQLGLVRKIIVYVPFFLTIKYLAKSHEPIGNKALVAISCIGVLILPFTSIVHLISRLCYYFDVFTVAAIPIILKSEKNIIFRYSLLALILCALLYQYCDLFLNSVYTKRFLEFHTIFNS